MSCIYDKKKRRFNFTPSPHPRKWIKPPLSTTHTHVVQYRIYGGSKYKSQIGNRLVETYQCLWVFFRCVYNIYRSRWVACIQIRLAVLVEFD